jgi:AraC family transcriptional regulator, alkane utilization regulator
VRRLYDSLDEDVVNDVLTSLRVRSTVYCQSELRAPWGFAVRAREVSAFHVVMDGTCWLEVDDLAEPVRLDPGDLVLLMTGRGHRMRDAPASEIEWLDDILARAPKQRSSLRYGGSGPRTELLCGGFMVEGAQANPLVLAMPPLLRLEGEDQTTVAWREALLEVLHVEVRQPRPGTDAILSRLADLLLTQAIRAYLLSLADADQPQVGAMRDPRIAKAIRLVHADPARSWAVEELASEVAMSRSAFAERFRQLTGEPPMRYVTRCRLARAASFLAQDRSTLFEVARRTGFASEASFTRAFSRAFGMAPGAYRRRLREPGHATPRRRSGSDDAASIRRAIGPPVASSARTTMSQPVGRWMESGNDCCASVRDPQVRWRR